jgi:GT2 family glycosyltransferase
MTSILIINWNKKHLVADCLVSIRQKVLGEYEVIVVDNNSSDGSVDFLAENFPWVKLVASPDNLGFAAGNNLAARHASGEYLLLLNNDTLLQTDIADAVLALDRDKRIGAVGAAMFGEAGELRPSCGRFPTPSRLWRFASLYVRKSTKWPTPLEIELLRCDFIEGSFLLTPMDAWRKLGGMDERNYMYGDDLEYCRSLYGLGLVTVQCPSVRYTHFGGYDHSKMGYLFGGFRRYHRKFSSRRVQIQADFVLRAGLLLRLPWYWLRAQLRKDAASCSALHSVLDLNRNWSKTLLDAHRYHS